MKLVTLFLLTVMSFNACSSFIYNFEEIEMRNDSDLNNTGLLSGYIQYASAADVNSYTFEKFEFIFSFGSETVVMDTSFLNDIAIVDVTDGLFGNSVNGDGEGFEFFVELQDSFVTIYNGFFGFGANDTCFDIENKSSGDTSMYCAGSLISVSGPDLQSTDVSAPGILALFFLAMCGVVIRKEFM